MDKDRMRRKVHAHTQEQNPKTQSNKQTNKQKQEQ